jgi:hypothetical protein
MVPALGSDCAEQLPEVMLGWRCSKARRGLGLFDLAALLPFRLDLPGGVVGASSKPLGLERRSDAHVNRDAP